eukprot:CAMPEP_0170134130 /NCGR_PEP_ID=MMETSP0033_2-20121228/1719_1 /TAXON_ID=195969 /ORGANISM="Dolichomastix tenuilepis, Strain CCMP3274" /LENGTH=450 /DNA_ID=CAMNT_0010369673 /DNA_START=53 /DNA_END=1405 /DNA_ORIENTATION=+
MCLAQQNALTPGRQYLTIRGKVYDVTDFVETHPGGSQLVSLGVGRDATILFESHHIRTDVVEKALQALPVVDMSKVAANPAEAAKMVGMPLEQFALPGDSALYRTLRKRIREEVLEPAGKGWRRVSSGRGGLMSETIFGLFVWGVIVAAYLYSPNLLTGLLTGLAGYWTGVGVQHTANHGGLSRSGFLNAILGFIACDVTIGKSSLEWRYHHLVSHHAYCNDSELDQDVFDLFPVLRFTDEKPLSWFHRYQHFYMWILLPFLWFSTQVADVQKTMSRLTGNIGYFGVSDTEIQLMWLGKVLHITLMLGVPAYIHGITRVMPAFLMFVFSGSLVLTTMFLVSHNIDGALPSQFAQQSSRNDWAKYQIETTATWGNWFWGKLAGGLNYQVEHHLFPSVAHNLYPKMQPIIKEECAKIGIPYKSWDGYLAFPKIVYELFAQMRTNGRTPVKAA